MKGVGRGLAVWRAVGLTLALLISGDAFAQGIPGCGDELFTERFEDANLASRGWYDGASGTISTTGNLPGSAGSFECRFAPGSTNCVGGHPARHGFAATDSLYVRFLLKFGDEWVGSGQPYHPHMFNFYTNLDGDFVAPTDTHLTTYAEVVNGRPVMSVQDNQNVDEACIWMYPGGFIGCNGDFDTYVFSEERSVATCNGLQGEVDLYSCWGQSGTWTSAREWHSDIVTFGDGPPPFDKQSWHVVEIYYELNSIQNGVAVPDGKLRWLQDGVTILSSDEILYRTGEHPTMGFDQVALLPYIGNSGSPIDQRFWMDEMTFATASPDFCPAVPASSPASTGLLVAALVAVVSAVPTRRRRTPAA
jgi:hypothetical protein